MTSAPTTVLITGAAGHLGRRIAHSMAQRSATVALSDIDEQALVSVAGSIVGAAAFPADVTDPGAAAGLVADVTNRFGPIDVVVNAAGVEGSVAPIEDIDPDQLRHVFEVNVMSVFWICQAVVPAMKARRQGRIVNMASGAGLAGGALASPYHASKHAVVGLTRSLARELAPWDIAVNALCPGYVDSPMVDRIMEAEELATGRAPEVIDSIPMGRMAEPDEVAATVTFLALDAPVYMTGASLVLDGALRA